MGDVELLVLTVPGELNHLHPVEESGLNRVELVGGGDEEDLGEVEGNSQVVVSEGVVLLGVEDFQEGRGGVSPVVGADLVHFVQHEDRVVRAGLPEALEDSAREGADIGPAVAADLRFVVNPSERGADEVSPHGPGNGAAQGGLPDAGRSDEAEDGPLGTLCEFADGQVLKDSLLDLFEIVVVLVEDLLRLLDVDVVFTGCGPREGEHCVEVGTDQVAFRGFRAHLGQPGKLSLHFLERLFRKHKPRELLPVGLDLFVHLPGFTQLLLDGLHLLAEVVFLLQGIDLLLGLRGDLLLHLEQLHLFEEELVDPLKPGHRFFQLQGVLGLRNREGQVGEDVVGQSPGLLNLLDVVDQFGGKLLAQFYELFEGLLQVLLQGLELQGLLRGFHIADKLDLRQGVGPFQVQLFDAGAENALDEEAHVSAGKLQHPKDQDHRAHPVDVLLHRLFHLGVLLREKEDHPVPVKGLIDGLLRLLTADVEGEGHVGKDRQVPNEDHRKLIGDRVRDVAGIRRPLVGNVEALDGDLFSILFTLLLFRGDRLFLLFVVAHSFSPCSVLMETLFLFLVFGRETVRTPWEKVASVFSSTMGSGNDTLLVKEPKDLSKRR